MQWCSRGVGRQWTTAQSTIWDWVQLKFRRRSSGFTLDQTNGRAQLGSQVESFLLGLYFILLFRTESNPGRSPKRENKKEEIEAFVINPGKYNMVFEDGYMGADRVIEILLRRCNMSMLCFRSNCIV